MTQNNVIQFPTVQSQPVVAPAPIAQPTVSQGFDVTRYLPKTAQPISLIETNSGTHQIAHKIYEFLFKVTESRVELVVFGCLIRYTLGYHRSTCEASNRFISEWSGLSETSVRNGLVPLLAKNLIVCIKKGKSSDDPSIYEIPIIKGFLESSQSTEIQPPKPTSTSPSLSSQNPISKLDQNNTGASAAPSPTGAPRTLSAQYCAPPMRGTGHPVCAKKDNININTKETLTQPEIQNQNQTEEKGTEQTKINQKPPKCISTYFAGLTLPQKHQSEKRHYISLLGHYNSEVISQALEFVLEKGIPGSGQKCHSPMAFLACSMPNVLSLVDTENESRCRKIHEEQEAATKEKLEQEEAKRENAQFLRDIQRFEKAHPTELEQLAVFSEFARRYPIFAKTDKILKSAAISEWASRQ